MYGEEKEAVYSYAPAPDRNTIELSSDSDFARAVKGREPEEVFPVIDELMNTLAVMQPRLYSAVMMKLA